MMQPVTGPPRDDLSVDQVTALIRDEPAVHSTYGCELIDMNLDVIEDISDDLVGGSVKRQSYDRLHGEAELVLHRELDWGTAILRPYVVVSASGVSARFNLGAYFTSTDKVDYGTDPVEYKVKALDILDRLDDPVGESYAVASGAVYLSTVEEIFTNLGYTQHVIDKLYSISGAEKKLPLSRTWMLGEGATWLTVVNEMLGSIAYQGVWSDWDGRLRVHPYRSPSSQPSEWAYDVENLTSMLGAVRTKESDRYRAPNRWVFYRSNTTDEDDPPTEGNGKYTVENQSDGPTSIDARGGRVITREVGLDVADHASLVEAAQITVDADKRLKTTISVPVWPNPLHWHFDRVSAVDPAVGLSGEVLVTSWAMPLDGGMMTQEWTVL